MFRRLCMETLESRQVLAPVVPSVETVSAGGAADDIAIWVHPTDPGQSRVIGAIKSGGSAIEVYRLDGTSAQTITTGDINNIDLRYNFPTAAGDITLLAGSNRANDSIALYRIDASGTLTNVAARTIATGISVYGCTMYVSPHTGKFYVFMSSEAGEVQQWELRDAGGGTVDAVRVREFDVGRITEGLVADDVTAYLYAGEEDVGIWRYSAEPNGGTARTRVDATGSSGHLSADVEGLAIYYRPDGEGYLIASSQGSDDFVVYERQAGNRYVGRFHLVAGGAIDAVADTDGIDVTNFPLGGDFPSGLFVAQDSDVNFKLVAWEDVAVAIDVEIDTSWDPRALGASEAPPSSQGDFNSDGVVDAADYTVWRNRVGSSVSAYSGADANGNGLIEVDDYLIWKAHFGLVVDSAQAFQLSEPAFVTAADVALQPITPWEDSRVAGQATGEIPIDEAVEIAYADETRRRQLLLPTAPSSKLAGREGRQLTPPPDELCEDDFRKATAEVAWSEWADSISSAWRCVH